MPESGLRSYCIDEAVREHENDRAVGRRGRMSRGTVRRDVCERISRLFRIAWEAAKLVVVWNKRRKRMRFIMVLSGLS
jgi:hypothetical protein